MSRLDDLKRGNDKNWNARVPVLESTVNALSDMMNSSGSSLNTIVAAENIPANSPITSQGKVADSSALSAFQKVIGITKDSILSGFSGRFVSTGRIVKNSGWNWISGQVIFLNGTALSPTPPSSGFIQKIGAACAADSILLEINEPILI